MNTSQKELLTEVRNDLMRMAAKSKINDSKAAEKTIEIIESVDFIDDIINHGFCHECGRAFWYNPEFSESGICEECDEIMKEYVDEQSMKDSYLKS